MKTKEIPVFGDIYKTNKWTFPDDNQIGLWIFDLNSGFGSLVHWRCGKCKKTRAPYSIWLAKFTYAWHIKRCKVKVIEQESTLIPFFTAQINDLIGGFIVSSYPHPLSEHDHRPNGDPNKRGVIVAECTTRPHAELLAGLLNAYVEAGGSIPDHPWL